jgi:monoterpene epsilon-lactone hydrolase
MSKTGNMYGVKSTLIRGTQWISRLAAIPFLGSIPTLRNGAGAGEKKIQVPKGIHWEAVDANGVRCEWLIPANASTDAVLLYLHGGGGVLGLYNFARNLAGHIALACNLRTLLVDYRLAPENPFPAGLNDCIATYHWLVSQGFQSHRIVIAGDSVGGYFTISMLLKLRDHNQPFPAAAVCVSPSTDHTLSGKSIKTNAHKDALLSPKFLRKMVSLHFGGHDLHDPYISPLSADLHGLPPLLIQAGADEILLDDSIRFRDAAQAAGLELTLEVWPHMWHDWHSCVPKLREANQAIEQIAEFIKIYL